MDEDYCDCGLFIFLRFDSYQFPASGVGGAEIIEADWKLLAGGSAVYCADGFDCGTAAVPEQTFTPDFDGYATVKKICCCVGNFVYWYHSGFQSLRNLQCEICADEICSILREIKSRYGVYACYGNHDIEEKILVGFTFPNDKKKESDPRMDRFLEDAKITLLRDESVLIDDSFYLVGRPDYGRPGRGIEQRKSPEEIMAELDESKPVFILEHEPREIEELSEAGADMQLCGHTHDGQVWPGTWTIHLFWENPYGYLKKGELHSIVTSGIGVYGPAMRVDSKSEVCEIDLEFQ